MSEAVAIARHDIERRVGRAAVDEDVLDLDALLRPDGADRPLDRRAGVEADRDDRDDRHAGTPPRRCTVSRSIVITARLSPAAAMRSNGMTSPIEMGSREPMRR